MDPALRIFDSLLAAQDRGLLPTTLDTAGIRDLAASIRANSVFSATVADADFLTKIKEVVNSIASGNMDDATARVTLLETLRAIGYTPEGGFPSVRAGAVAPALAGTLQDLSSSIRLNLIVDTQRGLMQGAGQQMRGHTPDRLKAFPAWELVRMLTARMPRNWNGRESYTPPKGRHHDPRPRWIIAGGKTRADGRMIALKGDPVWGELGSHGNFSDAIDVDHPPFAFNSSMGWDEVDEEECISLGITGPIGESPEEWFSSRPIVITHTLPKPKASSRNLDPALLIHMHQQGISEDDGPGSIAAITSGQADRLQASIDARNAELARRAAQA